MLFKVQLAEQGHVAETGRAAAIVDRRGFGQGSCTPSRMPVRRDPGQPHGEHKIVGDAVGERQRLAFDGFQAVHIIADSTARSGRSTGAS